ICAATNAWIRFAGSGYQRSHLRSPGPAKPAKKKQIANLAVLRVATPAPSAFMPLIAKQIPTMRTLLNAAARSSLRLDKETLDSNRGSIACRTRKTLDRNGFSNLHSD